MFTMQQALKRVAIGRALSEDEAADVCRAIISGEATPVQIAGLLMGLRVKGETVDELVGFARAMRAAATPITPPHAPLVDTCGTGGDGLGTFNISTVAAFVAAGAGCTVAKHGNRWISGKCGSADVLEALGVRVELAPAQAARSIDEIGIGFLFAPLYHAGTRHAAEARRAIGVRSLFNVLGPLANPAGARRQLVGVCEPELVEKVALALRRLGAERALAVHGLDGLDELTPTTATRVCELCDGQVRTFETTPEELGLKRSPLESLKGGDAATNAGIARGIVEGRENGARRDVVAMNAGAVIYVAGRAATLREGVEQAQESIARGQALEKLDALARFTQDVCRA